MLEAIDAIVLIVMSTVSQMTAGALEVSPASLVLSRRKLRNLLVRSRDEAHS